MADVFIDPTNGRIYWNDNAGSPQSIAIDGNTQDTISFVGYSGSFSPGSTPTQTNVLLTVKDNGPNDVLIPGTNGYSLGSSSNRWNTYATSLNLNDFIFTGSGSSFDISNASAIGQTINFFNSGTQLQFNFGVGASLASTATFFGSVNSNRMILNVNSSGNVYVQTNQTNARVRLFQNNTTGNVSIFGTGGGTLFLGEDTTTNNSDIALKGTVLFSAGAGNIRAGIFSLATATSNGSGAGGTILFQTSTSGNATAGSSNLLRTRLRIEGAATGTSNLESIIGFGDTSSGTAWTSHLRGVDATGNNIEAGEIQIQAGRSTGSGVAQGISFYVSSSGAGAAVLNTPLQIGRFTGTGFTIYPVTASTSTTSGALIVAGGASVGQTLSVGGSLNIFNGANFSGFRFTGTANTTYTLPPRTPTGTGTSFLSSGIDGVMAWVAAPTSGGSGTINSSTVNNIAYYSGSTTLSGESIASGNYFYYNGTNNGLNIAHTDNEFNPTASTGLLRVGTGATNYSTNRKALAVVSTNNAWTDGDLLILGVGNLAANIRFGVDWTGRVQIGTPGTGFTLPSTNGTSGQVLTANTNGLATWTTVTGSSGAGSGTVAIPGGQYQVAAYYHSATGASVSGSTTFTNSTASGVVNISHTTGSGSTTTGALVVAGGVGIGGTLNVFDNINIRSQNDLLLWNLDNSRYTSLQAGNITNSYTLSLPTAPVAAGSSVIVTGSDGNQYFTAPGSGIAFSSATANTPIIRTKRPLNLQFSSGYTPLAAGPDNVVLTIPDSPIDGVSQVTYNLRDFYIRVETPSAGSSRIQLERSTGTGAFTLAATGSSYLGGLGLTISGAGIYVTQTTTFAGAFLTSGDNLRLNWTLLNATHANFSVQLLLEEV